MLFVAFWLADAAWWWLSPATFRTRPAALDRAVRVFILFIFANGAIVFPHGPVRVLGVLVMIAASSRRGTVTDREHRCQEAER